MQVVYNSKLNFLQVVGVSLLISLWIFLCSFLSFRSYNLILGRKTERKREKKPVTDFKPNKWALVVFLNVVGQGGLGSVVFSHLCGSMLGVHSGLSYSEVSNLQPKPSECYMTPTVHMCQAGGFNSPHYATLWSMRYIEWEQLVPLLPLYWSGHCAFTK